MSARVRMPRVRDIGAGADSELASHSGAATNARRALATLAAELESIPGHAAAPRVMEALRQGLGELERELGARTREVQAQRHFIEQVVDALPVGLYVVDREYRVQAWNHTRETGLQGIARGEALGRTIFEVLHRQPAETLRKEYDAVFASGELRQYETESPGPGAHGQSPRTYRISKIPLRLGGGDVTHVITVGEDVTAWKEAESRLAHTEKLAAIGQLAAGVMHEINNPLATIAACAETMALYFDGTAAGATGGSTPSNGESAPVPAQHAEYLRVIEAEVRRCKGIVEGLLDFSRARPADRAAVDINAIVDQTLFLLKHHTRFKPMTVRSELDAAHGVVVSANPEQLVQVFMALLLNAADAIEERRKAEATGAEATGAEATGAEATGAEGTGADAGGRDPSRDRGRQPKTAGTITIRTRPAKARGLETGVIAEVIDEGAGIPRSAMRKIFEPFYTTKPPGRGTGLGLSVCYGIVADHGGRMEVESEPGKGSTFRVILPAAVAAVSGTDHGKQPNSNTPTHKQAEKQTGMRRRA
jgi:two-component system, NtrC family, sensor kinase